MAKVQSHKCIYDKENPAVAVLALVFCGNIGRLRWEYNECHETTCGSYSSFGKKTQHVGSFDSKNQHVATSQKGIEGSIKRRHCNELDNNKLATNCAWWREKMNPKISKLKKNI